MTKTYSQAEMDEMKKELDVNFQLINLTKTCDDINNAVLKHISMEKEDSMGVMAAIEVSVVDRRKCEKELHGKIDDNTTLYFNTFVKKTDLKVYATLIMLTIAAAGTFQAYVTNKNAPSIQLLERIETIIESTHK